jgi:hypothetical protein
MNNKHFLLWLFLFSCTNKGINDPMQIFLKEKNYKYSDKKTDIPNTVLLDLMKKNDSILKIADFNNYDSLCLTDDCNDGFTYNAKLNFILYSDSEYLISYTKGGVGLHGVIEYYKMEGRKFNVTKNVIPPIEDTVNLLFRINNL